MSETGDPLRTRLGWHAERAVARVLGRKFLCAECGRPLFVALPVTWRGKLVLIGLRDQNRQVHVRFHRRDALEFRHVELDACPSPERPWVR
jgi:hypothetical protein